MSGWLFFSAIQRCQPCSHDPCGPTIKGFIHEPDLVSEPARQPHQAKCHCRSALQAAPANLARGDLTVNGNALEWFDVLIYSVMAVTIAKLFFPTENQTVSLMITFATFGVSFFMRPPGAIVIGSYSDRVGRKAALTLSILLMMIGTLMIAIMPTYA
jgi:predicted MFS family arabinose efflux permease